MKFFKYQALGNDYIVIPAAELSIDTPLLTEAHIQRICHRQYGVGSDGILIGPFPSDEADFRLRLFNPDGGEFEKSGNGLRIFARYLWDQGLVESAPFTMMTPGGRVEAQVYANGQRIAVEMGQISFDSSQIPVLGATREVLNETLSLDGKAFPYCAATIGNPHCVILCDEMTMAASMNAMALQWGPLIEHDPHFPNRTNVQFMQVLDRQNIQIEIWERGAGYTLASGSSSCAAASVAHRLGWCDAQIAVHCPGGIIQIEIKPDWTIKMVGAVGKVCEGYLADDLLT